MPVYLTKREQNILDEKKFIYVPTSKDNCISASKLLETFLGLKEGNRVALLNFGVKNNKHLVISNDDYSKNIIDNLDKDAKQMLKLSLSDKKNVAYGGIAAYCINGSGVLSYLLFNVGTDDKPSWRRLENITVNVLTSGFYLKKGETGLPSKGVVRVFNTNEISEECNYKDYISNKDLDNETMCRCVEIIQEELRICMEKIIKDKHAVLGPNTNESSKKNLFSESRSLSIDPLDGGSMYRRCTIRKENDDFISIKNEDVKKNCFNIRFPITEINDSDKNKTFNDSVIKSGGGKLQYNALNKFILSQFNPIYFRHINTELLGTNNNLAILDFQVALAAFKPGAKDSATDKHDNIFAFRRNDVDFEGEDNTAYYNFNKAKSQIINTVLNVKLFINRKSISVNFDPVSFKPIFIVRLDNSLPKNKPYLEFDEFKDISEKVNDKNNKLIDIDETPKKISDKKSKGKSDKKSKKHYSESESESDSESDYTPVKKRGKKVSVKPVSESESEEEEIRGNVYKNDDINTDYYSDDEVDDYADDKPQGKKASTESESEEEIPAKKRGNIVNKKDVESDYYSDDEIPVKTRGKKASTESESEDEIPAKTRGKKVSTESESEDEIPVKTRGKKVSTESESESESEEEVEKPRAKKLRNTQHAHTKHRSRDVDYEIRSRSPK